MDDSKSGRVWVLGQSVLMLTQITLGVTHRDAWHSPASFAVGVFLFVCGAVAGIWGVRSLGRSRTPFPAPPTGAVLVQTGIYRHLRHPLYSSVMLASIGWALLWQSAVALAAALPLCVFFDAKSRLEERLLQTRFPEYADYRKRTHRFLPWVY